MRKTMLFVAAALVAVTVTEAFGDQTSVMPPSHGIFAPGDIKWVDAAPSLPSGAKMAVLKGDPSKEDIFVLRLKLPAGFRIMPHWHPAYENMTVISGEANIGLGDVFDKTKGVKIPAGGFGYITPQMHHFFWVDGETVIQVHGVGPWQRYFLNPDDDPRRMTSKK